MATLDDVRRIAESLPEVVCKPAWGNDMWRVRGKGFVWERPLNKTDRAALGDDPPEGELAAVRMSSELAKGELIASEPEVFFTIPHFDGTGSLLIRLGNIEVDELTELITDAWILRAPKRLAADFLARHP